MALEKVSREQLIRKWFEIYQTISCFGAFLLTLSLNSIMELVSKSIKLASVIEIVIESYFINFLPTKLKEIHTISSLSYFQVQLPKFDYFRALKYFSIILLTHSL